VNAGHPCNERFGILKRPTALPGVHPGKERTSLRDEVKREIKFSALDPALIIHAPVAIVRVRASLTILRWHGRPEGASGVFSLMVGLSGLFNTAL